MYLCGETISIIMKNYLLATLIVMLSVFCLGSKCFAQEPTVVVIVNSDIGNGPRSQSSVPITACVISDTIYLSFSSDLGEVDVVLEESSEGVILQTSVDSSTLSAIIPFSGAPGEYYITITLPSGAVYEGQFEIY